MSMTVLNVAYPLAPVGPDAVGGAEQVLSALDAALVEIESAMKLGGARTGKRVIIAEGLELEGFTDPFDTEIMFGERIGVVGLNGTGKSHFLRLLAGAEVAHAGEWRLGARVVPGYFSQLL